jgi:prevent-host-death family protein
MEQIGVREFKANLSAFLRRVDNGEEFHVTDHGRPVALLSPISFYPEPGNTASLLSEPTAPEYVAETSATGKAHKTSRAKPPKEESYASLLKYAQKRGKYKTQKEALTEVLRQHVGRLRRLELVELFGTIDYDPDYDYKALRRLR